MMRILIVEDERVVAQRLMKIVRHILPETIESIRHLEYFSDALDYLRNHPIDVLFLDLNLGGEDGFKILGEATSESFQTIIVSAHADQALRAFEYGVVDFIAKPFTEERLRKAIDRLREPRLSQTAKHIAVKDAGRVQIIPIDDVLYIKGADDYSEIHRRDGSVLLHNKSLRSLQQTLPDTFQRLHKSFLVNMACVTGRESSSGSRYFAVLENGEKLNLSRKSINFFKTLF